MKLQHYIGGLENVGPVAFERKVFVEPWETRIFGIHVAMMALSSQLPLPATPSGFHTSLDLGGSAQRRRVAQSVRLLQISLL